MKLYEYLRQQNICMTFEKLGLTTVLLFTRHKSKKYINNFHIIHSYEVRELNANNQQKLDNKDWFLYTFAVNIKTLCVVIIRLILLGIVV